MDRTGELRIPLLDAFGMAIFISGVRVFDLLPDREHAPRLMLGQTVLRRESWSIPAAAPRRRRDGDGRASAAFTRRRKEIVMTRTRIIVVLAAAAFAVATQTASAQPAHPTKRAEPADALIDRWDTGPIPAAELRSTFRRAGYTTWAVARFFHAFGIDKTFEFELVFYRVHGTLFQIRRSWDPPASGQMPTGGDRGPCRFLGGHRFTVSNIGPATDGIRATFAFARNGDKLRVRFLGLVVPFREAQVLYDRMLLTASAFRSYRRID